MTATQLRSTSGQLDLFAGDDTRATGRFHAIDHINARYGEFTVAPAVLLERSTMPNVIAAGLAAGRTPAAHTGLRVSSISPKLFRQFFIDTFLRIINGFLK